MTGVPIYSGISAWGTDRFIKDGDQPESIQAVAFKNGAGRGVADMLVPTLKSDVARDAGTPIRHPVGWS